MGLEFMMPQEFIERAMGLAGAKDREKENPWSKGNLTWRLLPHIKDYAQELGVTEPSSRDRFALAGLLADQFDQYSHFRPGIITKWDQGTSAVKSAWADMDKENEKWQRELWRKLQSEINETGKPRPHPALWLKTMVFSNP